MAELGGSLPEIPGLKDIVDHDLGINQFNFPSLEGDTPVGIVPGMSIGPYLIEELAGRGGFGVVYRAHHEKLKRTAAVKVLPPVADSPQEFSRFLHEAQAIAQLRHPHILSAYDFGEFSGRPYMVTEFMANGTLADLLKQDQMTADASLKMLRSLAEAIDYAHSKGVIHRDIKPANVFLGDDYAPVLGDFGLAKVFGGTDSVTMTGTVAGSPFYVSPEQASGKTVTSATDRYSFGVVAYQLLAGRLPFMGGLVDVLYSHIHSPCLPPSSFNHSLPEAVDMVLLKALSKNPLDRWGSCMEMVIALQDALRGISADKIIPDNFMTPITHTTTEAMLAAAQASLPESQVEANTRIPRYLAMAFSAILVIALVGLGSAPFVAAIFKSPSTQLSTNTAYPGDRLTVTTSHLPSNTLATVFLESIPVTLGQGRSDSDGNFSYQTEVPIGTDPGHHIVKVCWTSSSCSAPANLTVLDISLNASPSPTPSPSIETQISPSPFISATPIASPRSIP